MYHLYREVGFMGTILKNEIKRTRFGLFIWCLIAGLIAYLGILEYPMLAPFVSEMESALSAIPKVGQLVFGVYKADLTIPLGFYIVMYYWIGLIIFVHAVYTGASIIMKESRDNTAEFIFTKPYKRSVIVGAKLLAGVFNITVMCLVMVALSAVGMIQAIGDPSITGAVLISGVGMFITQLVLMSLGFLCSAIFKTYKSGVFAAMVVLITSYTLMFTVQYFDVSNLNFISPLTYFAVYETTENGLSFVYIVIAAVVTAVCLFLTQRLYREKVMV